MSATPSLAELPFRRSAEKAIRKAALADDASGFRKALLKTLDKPRKSLRKKLPTAIWPTCLDRVRAMLEQAAADAEDLTAAAAADRCLLPESDQEFARTVASREDAIAQLTADTTRLGPLRAFVAAEILTRDGEDLTAEQTVQLYVQLAGSLGEADWQPRELTADAPATAAMVAMDAFTLGESLVLSAYVLAELKPARPMYRTAMDNLAALLDESTDTDGLLHGQLQPVAHWLIGSFARVSVMADCFDEPWATARTQSRWRSTLNLIAQQCDHRGPALVPLEDTSAADLLPELRAAAKVVDKDNPVARLLRDLQKSRPAARPKTKSLRAADSTQSDWAEAALLRDRIDASGNAITATWSQADVQLGVSCLGRRLLTGAWNFETTIDGVPSEPAGSWVCTCWFEDNDVAFLELERGSTDGSRHVRQVVLVLNASLAVFTDTITAADKDAQVAFTGKLPAFADHALQLQTNTITRELRGNQSLPDLRVIPLWLHDDRLHSTTGDCRTQEQRLVMTESGAGGVTVPVLLDWSEVRSKAEADWNRLTVTEERERLTGHTAAGFRVRLGRLQLLIYRSLRVGQTLRAVLGYNTACETVYGRVVKNGRIAPLVMVESEVDA